MQISVWDTYVQRGDGKVMHFDILVPSTVTDPEKVYGFGKSYLNSKPFETGKLSAKECRFCHIQAAPHEVVKKVAEFGYYIIEMENCH